MHSFFPLQKNPNWAALLQTCKSKYCYKLFIFPNLSIEKNAFNKKLQFHRMELLNTKLLNKDPNFQCFDNFNIMQFSISDFTC